MASAVIAGTGVNVLFRDYSMEGKLVFWGNFSLHVADRNAQLVNSFNSSRSDGR